MTRIACSRASCDISVYYVPPLVGLGESFFPFSLLLWTRGLVVYNKSAKTA